ncbi:Asp-tRNA(Asn)/Glu-tRNA(Gln) amidotransferase subunit GatC [Candidatus Gracilibacteria bacterium]|nr:Asp-tRNA(Asn)/Glu-tRNA(Gln) amidotransferase subunit GatC [Candidatus Gracilibacteria bacterium]
MITEEEVLHIAKLAKLKLTPEELKTFPNQLSQILDFFGQLQEVDTEGVEETSQVTGLENINRKDEICVTENTEDLLECSPHPIENRSIKIPKIL